LPAQQGGKNRNSSSQLTRGGGQSNEKLRAERVAAMFKKAKARMHVKASYQQLQAAQAG
jgi:hypothetical protein